VWLEGALPIEAVVVPFSKGASYTGDEMVEIYLVSSSPIVRAVLDRLDGLGVRGAEPGEFTKRAFLAGRMDLSRAESVNQLIAAEDLQAARAARRALDGHVYRRVRALGESIHRVVALLEAGLDFSEQEVDPPDPEELRRVLQPVEDEISSILSTPVQRTPDRPRVQILLWGRPNAGKSSLLNRLAGQSLAITSPEPGTTRDPIGVTLEWEPRVPFQLLDLAGDRGTDDPLEERAVEVAREHRADGDRFIWVLDGTRAPSDLEAEFAGVPTDLRDRSWFVLNKIDRVPGFPRSRLPDALPVSAVSGVGVEELRARIVEFLRGEGWEARASESGFNQRQRRRLEACRTALAEASMLEAEAGPELVVEELRAGLDALAEITGEITTEDTLDLIFREFCLGK
jgi:tRNA modification GTPase